LRIRTKKYTNRFGLFDGRVGRVFAMFVFAISLWNPILNSRSVSSLSYALHKSVAKGEVERPKP